MQQTLTYPAWPRRKGLVLGITVSLLLHAVLLLMLRAPQAPPARDERRWSQPLTVRLLPPPPPKVAVAPEPPPVERKRERAAPRADRQRTPEAPAAERPAMTVVTPAPAETTPAPAEPAPKFDADAARAAARGMANDLSTPSGNWAAEKLNKGKEWKETKEERLGRNVANSARPDCRTAYAGAGLFAPLFMLADKKDSGCKF